MTITIYHNPRCSKSRQALDLLTDKGVQPQIIEYLKNPPTENELDEILKKLQLEPEDLVRKKEEAYASLGLKDKSLSKSQWINVLVQNPVLIERPIVVAGDKAVIGRPPENVHKLF